MNYLAHLFLSRNHPESVLGNYLTDMMTITEINIHLGKNNPGVLLHRMIDKYTDQHEVNRNMKTILRPYFHKYAGVALDLYYDFILYKNWEQYSDLPFPDFTQSQYKIIRSQQSAIPDRIIPTVKRMIAGDFLLRYTTIEGQIFAFSNMDTRAKFYTGFEKAMEVLELHEQDLTNHFNLFFPDIIKEVEVFID